MTKRQGLWASLIIIGVALLPGCISIGTWQAYPGKKLSNKETGLIKRGNDLRFWHIDGEYIPTEHVILDPMFILGDYWERKAIRVLPGEHEMSAGHPWTTGPGSKSLTFEAEAGRVYTFFGKREEHYYVWLKDESGTVIAGEKPPPD